ncbi:Tar ligand binding domain-containing protein, partial [Pantoea septica]|uniref:Tar ligand binding domain-containing protein n=1 Tax=Pantoea septica TaxID=472695 RepID=UPI0028972F36
MLTKIRVVTSLLLVLLMFGLFQAFSGAAFFSALSDDKTSFNVSQLASKNLQALSDAYMSLNQSRVVLTRIQLRIANSKVDGSTPDIASLFTDSQQFQQTAANNFNLFKATPDTPGQNAALNNQLMDAYGVYATALTQLQTALQANNLAEAGKAPVAPSQNAFLKVYTDWRANKAHLTELGIEKNASAYTRMLWILGTIMTLVVVVIALCWIGLRRVLINPLNANIAHIQQIAQGDLTQR